jgi:hypothetical protein
VNGATQSETVANQFRFAVYDYGATAHPGADEYIRALV